MEHEHNSPDTQTLPAAIRHDGWNGEKMASLLRGARRNRRRRRGLRQGADGRFGRLRAEAAEPDLCRGLGRRFDHRPRTAGRHPFARSIEGNVEQIYKDGVLIGERHVIDNRLGLAILRRLDRLAETGMTVEHSRRARSNIRSC